MRYRPVERDEPGPARPGEPAPRQDNRGPDHTSTTPWWMRVDEAHRSGPGDVLVFPPGEREIREAAEASLRKAHLRCRHRGVSSLLRPCQSAQEQARVFAPSKALVVLATNVAETSPHRAGIRYAGGQSAWPGSSATPTATRWSS